MIVAKQYGEMRTGTNLVRKMLLDEFDDVILLMHVLGDKHSEPAPLQEIWLNVQHSPRAAHVFVTKATMARPAVSTNRYDPGQLEYMAYMAPTIAKAWGQGCFPIVISARAPRPWLTSLWRFEVGLGRSPTPPIEALDRYERRYKSWLALSEVGCRVLVARLEDLIRSCDRTIHRLAASLDCSSRNDAANRPSADSAISLPAQKVRPCRWDHNPPALETAIEPADGSWSAEWATPAEIERAMLRIDGDLMVSLGYTREGYPAP